MKKNLAIALTARALTLGGATSVGIAQSQANAEESTTASSQTTKIDPMSGLVDALVKRFKLNKSDVQAVLNENRSKMDARREADAKTELSQLVKDGKLTQEQAGKITAKRAEIKKDMDTNRTKGTRPSEANMQSKRTELDKWFTDNGIDTSYRYLVMGGRHGGPGSHGRHMGDHDGNTRNQSTTRGTSTDSAITN